MGQRSGKPYEEIQLDFAFVSEPAVGVPASTVDKTPPVRVHRSARSRGLAKILTTAQSTLLDAPLDELDAHLPLLLEFCEAALTRALDIVPLRKEELFSAEEDRSLRGIGQSQWLLTEASARRELKATRSKGEKKKGRDTQDEV